VNGHFGVQWVGDRMAVVEGDQIQKGSLIYSRTLCTVYPCEGRAAGLFGMPLGFLAEPEPGPAGPSGSFEQAADRSRVGMRLRENSSKAVVKHLDTCTSEVRMLGVGM